MSESKTVDIETSIKEVGKSFVAPIEARLNQEGIARNALQLVTQKGDSPVAELIDGVDHFSYLTSTGLLARQSFSSLIEFNSLIVSQPIDISDFDLSPNYDAINNYKDKLYGDIKEGEDVPFIDMLDRVISFDEVANNICLTYHVYDRFSTGGIASLLKIITNNKIMGRKLFVPSFMFYELWDSYISGGMREEFTETGRVAKYGHLGVFPSDSLSNIAYITSDKLGFYYRKDELKIQPSIGKHGLIGIEEYNYVIYPKRAGRIVLRKEKQNELKDKSGN